MESSEITSQLLKNKYDLHKSPEVEHAAKRTQIKTGEKISQDPLVRIENYLNRFHEITDRENPEERERGIGAIKRLLLPKYVTKPEDIPESYWKLQEQILRERGQQGDYNRFSEAEKTRWKKELAGGLLDDQRSSLESWIDYLASPESVHIPDAMKYWVFRNVTDLQEYDKEKREFPKRSRGTVKMFPDINSDALSYVVKKIAQKYKGESFDISEFGYEQLTEEVKQKFKTYLEQENFGKLYAWANEFIQPIPEHMLKVTDGRWVKYEQDRKGTENYKWLNHSILGRGTGWCTTGLNTAKTQLQGGDFYVFYSNDKDNNPVYPRIAIRMDGGKIAEIRGVAFKQNLDPYVGDVLAKKLEEFPDRDQYFKKEADMKKLTEIDRKTNRGQSLTREDLVFLYEIDNKIEGFGYERDPRIKELRSQRNKEEDMLTIFNCEKSQIAHSIGEINKDTKAYVGTLTPGIFDFIRKYNVEHVYTSFPEGKIRRETLEIGGKTAKQLEQELKQANIHINDYAEDMLHSRNFTTLPNPETLDTVRLKAADLGLSGILTIDQVYAKVIELELELVPAEAGVHYRLKNRTQQRYDCLYMGMKQIADHVFELNCNDDGLCLDSDWMDTSYWWNPNNEFMVALRPLAAPERSSGGVRQVFEPKKLGLLDRLLKR